MLTQKCKKYIIIAHWMVTLRSHQLTGRMRLDSRRLKVIKNLGRSYLLVDKIQYYFVHFLWNIYNFVNRWQKEVAPMKACLMKRLFQPFEYIDHFTWNFWIRVQVANTFLCLLHFTTMVDNSLLMPIIHFSLLSHTCSMTTNVNW